MLASIRRRPVLPSTAMADHSQRKTKFSRRRVAMLAEAVVMVVVHVGRAIKNGPNLNSEFPDVHKAVRGAVDAWFAAYADDTAS